LGSAASNFFIDILLAVVDCRLVQPGGCRPQFERRIVCAGRAQLVAAFLVVARGVVVLKSEAFDSKVLV
jgi:hypothetical protein